MVISAAKLRTLHWAWILPILAFGITSLLMILAAKQGVEIAATYARRSDTPQEFQAPARLFAQILNGPAFFLTVWRGGFEVFGLYFSDAGRLPGVVLFWYWLGWALDRRLSGKSTPFMVSRPLRCTVYFALLGLSCLFSGWILYGLRAHMLFPSVLWFYVVHVGLKASALGLCVSLLWGALLVYYFLWKLVHAL